MTNNRQLIAAIEHLAESSRALDQLLRMSRSDVDQVLRLLSNPNAVEGLKRLLRTVRNMQTGTTRAGVAKTSSVKGGAADDLEATLDDLFADRERFPTVASISEFVAEVFRLKLPRDKDSRDRYIRKVILAVRGNPKALYHARNRLSHGEPDRKDRAYALLYDFIRGSLTD